MCTKINVDWTAWLEKNKVFFVIELIVESIREAITIDIIENQTVLSNTVAASHRRLFKLIKIK